MGPRANDYGDLHTPLAISLGKTFDSLTHVHVNACFLGVAFAIVLFSCLVWWYKERRVWAGYNTLVPTLLVAFALSFIYQVLLCSKVDSTYISRGVVVDSFAFFGLLILLLGLIYLCRMIPRMKEFLPFLIAFLFFQIEDTRTVFKDIHADYVPNAQFCIDFDREMIARIQEEQVTNDTIVIRIPQFDTPDNWPITSYSSGCASSVKVALKKHNVIKKDLFLRFRAEYRVSVNN